MLVDESGSVQVYHKSKLVVGVELMPFQAVLEPLMGGISIDMGGTNGSLGSGTERPILHTIDDKVVVFQKMDVSDFVIAESKEL